VGLAGAGSAAGGVSMAQDISAREIKINASFFINQLILRFQFGRNYILEK